MDNGSFKTVQIQRRRTSTPPGCIWMPEVEKPDRSMQAAWLKGLADNNVSSGNRKEHSLVTC